MAAARRALSASQRPATFGSVSWLQPAIFAAGVAVTGLAIVALRGLRAQAPSPPPESP